MPNVLPRGLFGRADGAVIGAASEPVDVQASDAAGAPFPASEVWASDAAGVPYLVWRRIPTAPTGASATYSGTGALPPFMSIAWTLPAVIAADQYEIRRPDGSLAGYATGGTATSFVDNDPLPLNGAYTVIGRLAGTSAAPVATNVVNLTAQPTGFTATNIAGTMYLAWTGPAYGYPDRYDIYINGVNSTSVGGSTASLSFPQQHGSSITYTVQAVLSGAASGAGPSAVGNVPADAPGVYELYSLVNPGAGSTFVQVNFVPPAGNVISGYEAEVFLSARGVWDAASGFPTTTPPPHTYTNVNYFAVYGGTYTWRVRTLSPGGTSAWATCGPKPLVALGPGGTVYTASCP